MKKRSSLSTRIVRAGLLGLGSVAGMAALTSGCLDRPVSPATPNTTNVVVDQIRQSGVDKIDMLFMIDNSISMADKQVLLADAVPALVSRLVTPICVDSATKAPVGPQPCAAGTEPEFPAIRDIHLGVVSSSLGSRGTGGVCSGAGVGLDDKGRLMGTPGIRTTPPIPASPDGQAFLTWNPDANPGQAAGSLIADFTTHVTGAGETGCGFEASLESWYRFLVDPQPPDTITTEGGFTQVLTCQGDGTDCGSNGTCVAGFCADKVVLEQRAQFLRGDSLVAIVMLSDENDCSIRDDGQGGLVNLQGEGGLPKGTPICATNPDDPGCTFINGENVPAAEDPLNLRCWDQKRRYGVDFLYPISRYVDGLKSPTIADRGGVATPNPLFSTGGGVSRDPSLVFLAGIVGVPWQLISTAESQAPGVPLEYLRASQIDWAKITKTGNTPPGDPRMIESKDLRPGLPSFSSNPNSDPIIGHDWDIAGASSGTAADLQYACIFELTTPRDCATTSGGCDCKALPPNSGVTGQSPLCWNGSAYTTTQVRAKAYPGQRQLETLRNFGDNAIVASICPKETQGATTGDGYGYNPAVAAIIDRLKEQLGGKCLTRAVTVDAAGEPQCSIVEALPVDPAIGCNCDGNANRVTPDPKLVPAVFDGLRRDLLCGPKSADQRPCDASGFCLCEIATSQDYNSCLNDENSQSVGWCYIDADVDPPIGNPALVEACNPKRQLRFVTTPQAPTPANNAIVFIACLGKPLSEAPPTPAP